MTRTETSTDAPASTRAPLAFHIGLAETGGPWLAQLFRANGLVARRWLGGQIGRNIATSAITGTEPLTPWPRAVLFADMQDSPLPPDPVADGARAFALLDRWFPAAIFILTERAREGWIAALWGRDGGRYRAGEALRRGVADTALPELWARDWEAHVAAVTAHFAGSRRLVRFDLETDAPGKLAKALAPDFALSVLPAEPPCAPSPSLRVPMRGAPRADGPAEPRFIAEVADHCLGTAHAEGGALAADARSDIYAEWDGNARVTGKRGEPLPLLRDGAGPHGRFFVSRPKFKIERVQGLLNELIALGHEMPLASDMQDARFLGADRRPASPRPLIVYNRRQGAGNMVLWPLPGYHSPGNPAYVHTKTPDDIAFSDKIDKLVWRGNLTGRPRAGPAAGIRALYRLLESARPGSPEAEAALDGLRSVPRADFVLRHAADPDFDVALTPGVNNAPLRKFAPFAAILGARQSPHWFYRFRYIASLAGHDTGSNFLMAAQSRSVVLKEEDGWELFYTALFRPWEHYIPLARGGADCREKLAWARAHPDECRAMSAAARAVCGQIARPANRRGTLGAIAEGYRAADR